MLENYAEVEAFFRGAREQAEAAGSAAAGAEAAVSPHGGDSVAARRGRPCTDRPEAEAADGVLAGRHAAN